MKHNQQKAFQIERTVWVDEDEMKLKSVQGKRLGQHLYAWLYKTQNR